MEVRSKAPTRGLALASAALVLGGLLVAGCGGGGDEFPTGKWTGTNPNGLVLLLDFRSDGTWVLYEGAGLDSVGENTSGTYSTTKDTFTFETDADCKARSPDSEKGTYGWKLENDQLTFTYVGKDECWGRVTSQDGLTLTPVE